MLGAPSEQPFCELQPHGEVGRIGRDIDQFARVLVQVEQQRRQATPEMHVFEILCTDDGEITLTRTYAEMPFGTTVRNRAEIELPMRGLAPVFRLLSIEQRDQRSAIEIPRYVAT